ncbi:MAG: hypothetical protein IT291_03425 [Deltaproteobacteria bacterium]|nr:hypothetical protein [Deltaproteobacteria bacterium]
MKKPKEREDLKELFNQCFFCTVTLGVSVLIDKTLVESLIETYSFAYEQLELLRWLAYPILLLLLAHASKIISPKEEEIKIGERRPPPKRIKS